MENTSLNIVKANEFQFRIYADEVITDPALIDAIEIRGICRYYDDVGELCYDTSAMPRSIICIAFLCTMKQAELNVVAILLLLTMHWITVINYQPNEAGQ